MSKITTGLPTPNNAINGIELAISSEIKEYYSVLTVGADYFVARDKFGKIIIRSKDGRVREWDNETSTVYETNLFVIDSKVYFPSKIDDQAFINVVSLEDNTQITQKYFTTDISYDSIAYNEFTRQIVIWKAFVAGSSNFHEYVYLFNVDSYLLTRVLDREVPTNKITSLFIIADPDTGDWYRAIVFPDGSHEVSRLGSGVTNKIYDDDVANNTTLIQDTNVEFIRYLTVANGSLYCFNRDMDSVAAWDISTPNTFTLNPTLIDTRPNLFHSVERPGYPRLQVDSSTGIIHDTRTFWSYDTINNVPVTTRYPICVSGDENQDYAINSSDRQPIRVFNEDQSIAFYRVSNENFIYRLNLRQVCPIPVGGIKNENQPQDFGLVNTSRKVETTKYVNVVDGPITEPLYLLTEMVGIVEDPTGIDGRPFYLDSNFTITERGTTLNVNGTDYLNLGVIPSLARVEWKGKYYIKTQTDIRVYDGTSETIIATPTPQADASIQSFVYRNKWIIISASLITSLDLSTSGVNQVATNLTRPHRVRLFANRFDDNLYLYDKDDASKVYLYNYSPSFIDHTDPAIYGPLVEEVYSNFNAIVNVSGTSTSWEMAFINPNTVAYFDYVNGLWQITEDGFLSKGVGTLTGQLEKEPVSSLAYNGPLIISRNSEELFINDEDSWTALNPNSFIVENVNKTLPILPSAVNKISIGVDSEGYMKWLANGLATGDPNKSYLVFFNNTSPTQNLPQIEANSLRFTFVSGLEALSVAIPQLLIEEEGYQKTRMLELDRKVFGDNGAVSAAEAPEVLETYSLDLVVDSDKLAEMLAVFYYQWCEYHQWDIIFEDSVYEYSEHKVAITGFGWQWHSKDLYSINLTFGEITLND